MNDTLEGWALLIDADIDRLKFVSQTLFSAGIRVSCARSMPQAASFLARHRPDLVLVHSGLPEARKAVSTIRESDSQEPLPVLLLTNGEEGEDALEDFFDAGICDILQLPPPLPRVIRSRVGLLLAAIRGSGSASSKAKAPAHPQVEGVSYEEAVKNCGGEDVLKEVFQKFYDSIEEKAGAIEGFAASGNWKDFRIAVHSLKSSARLIGALQLSEDARSLEYAAHELTDGAEEQAAEQAEGGQAADATEQAASKAAEIQAKTPALLALYRSYRERLIPLVHAEQEEDGPGEDAELLSEKDFLSACHDLQECIGISDFDSADFIMQTLGGYRIPEERREFMARLKKAVGDVNKQEALSLLSHISNTENSASKE